MNKLTLAKLADKAIEAAITAGGIISEYTGKYLDISSKEGGTSLASQIFTEVDLLSEQTILKILAPTIKEYDLGLLAEETADDNSRHTKDFFWCIDPLDGTLPFTEGIPGFSVSIALVSKDGTPIIGVVYDPVTSTLYHAIAGKEVCKNRQQWRIATSTDTMTFICDRSFIDSTHYEKTISDISTLSETENFTSINYMTQGGAAMNAMWVLEHAPAYYLKFPKPQKGGGSIWDYAATACIFNEINAHVSNSCGKPLHLNDPNTTYMNRQGILYASHKELAEKFLALQR